MAEQAAPVSFFTAQELFAAVERIKLLFLDSEGGR
jgi:hypothetical protein